MGDAQSHEAQEGGPWLPPGQASVDGGAVVPPLLQAGAALGADGDRPADVTSAGSAAALCNPMLLAQLVQLLASRTRHSLLLSDLGALLPANLRSGVKERGGLRSWLQKYPDLFQVTGQPGKESVMLLIGDTSALAAGVVDEARNPMLAAPEDLATPWNGARLLAEQAAALGPHAANRRPDPPGRPANALLPPAAQRAVAAAAEEEDEEDTEENDAAVQLRGLPYRATVADIKAFLGPHVTHLKGARGVEVVYNRDGRPSGFARVQFDSPAAARRARDELHMSVMRTRAANGEAAEGASDRYVEIFLFSERPNKLRFKKSIDTAGPGDGAEVDPDAAAVDKEQVVRELREHMASPGKAQLLLSMLGVALSQGSRLYLKRTDQGLKHFLAQYPQEFFLEGAKGREYVSYLPITVLRKDQAMLAGHAAAREPRDAPLPEPIGASPAKIRAPALPKDMGTPSDWGTPTIPMGAPPAPAPSAAFSRRAPSSGNINDLQRRLEADAVPESPPAPTISKGIGTPTMPTPSDWGTPQYTGWDGQPGQGDGHHHTSRHAGNGGYRPPLGGTGAGAEPAVPPEILAMFGGAPPFGAGPWSTGQWPPGVPCNGWPGVPGLWPPPVPGAFPPAHTWNLPPQDPAQDLRALVESKRKEEEKAKEKAKADEDGPISQIWLRGLPFTATEQDVLAFFAKHDVVERIAEVPQSVRLVHKANGKPTGQAYVLMSSPADAEVSVKVLNGQYIGSRYIEVFFGTVENKHGRLDKYGLAVGGEIILPEDHGPGLAGDTGGSGGGSSTASSAAAAAPGSRLSSGAAPAAVGGLLAAGGEPPGEAKWEALFDFLKRDGIAPKASPFLGGHAIPGGPAPGFGMPLPSSQATEASQAYTKLEV